MKTASALVSLLLVVTHACAAEVGAPAPEFALNNMQRNVKLSDYKGKTVYLDFWASWCAYAIKAMPTSLLIGTDGKVLHIHSGFRDEQRQVVEEQIKAALAAKR